MEPTGIKVLDDLLAGGLPRPSAVGLIGAVGSGKSSLVRQLAVNMLEKDFRVLYYAIDESAEDVREGVASYGINVAKYEEEGRLAFIDIFALEVERRKTPEGISRGGTLRLVKLGKTQIPSRGYYYEMTPQGIVISTAPPI